MASDLMRYRALFLFLFAGLIVAGFLAATPLHRVSAQCFDPQNPNNPIPCSGEEEKKKKKTEPAPSTSTPTQTPSPTPSPTATKSPIHTVFSTTTRPLMAGGFTCPPYAGSIPLGAGAMVLGLLILARRARITSPGYPPGRHQTLAKTDDSRFVRIEDAPAAPGQDATSSIWGFMMEFQKLLGREARSDRKMASLERENAIRARAERLENDNDSIDTAMDEANEKADQSVDAANAGLITGIVGGLAQIAGGLFSGNQGTGLTASQLVGNAMAGIGTGILGSALLGGLLGFDCISTNIVLPAGALLGMTAAIAAGLISQSQGQGSTGGVGMQEFEPMGPVESDGSVTGGAGLYKGKDLE